MFFRRFRPESISSFGGECVETGVNASWADVGEDMPVESGSESVSKPVLVGVFATRSGLFDDNGPAPRPVLFLRRFTARGDSIWSFGGVGVAARVDVDESEGSEVGCEIVDNLAHGRLFDGELTQTQFGLREDARRRPTAFLRRLQVAEFGSETTSLAVDGQSAEEGRSELRDCNRAVGVGEETTGADLGDCELDKCARRRFFDCENVGGSRKRHIDAEEGHIHEFSWRALIGDQTTNQKVLKR